jgi:hypothetical protein
MNLESLFNTALWLAGIGHFCILGASFQVPHRLQWKEDLSKLLPLNRKLMWTYGGFTVFAIVTFGILTLTLHQELLRGDRAALGLAIFNGLFWLLRILVDFFYFSHDDWPKGRWLAVGHFFLTSLFICLAGTYLGLVVWHYLK